MNVSTGVQFDIVPRTELASTVKGEMFRLFAEHFVGISPEQFARDLAEKNLGILLRRGGILVGFSTLLSYTTMFEGEALNIIYSGDTIVAPDAWGTTALPRAWVAGVETLREKLPPARCFWLLLTSGFRTYRFLPVFWREFFPRFDATTPAKTQRLLDELASQRFGEEFDKERGIVRFLQPQKLRDGLREIPAGRKSDPHIEFFVSRNSGSAKGDELVCLCELCPENLTAAGRRMMAPQDRATHCKYS